MRKQNVEGLGHGVVCALESRGKSPDLSVSRSFAPKTSALVGMASGCNTPSSRISGLSKRLSTLEQYISNPHVPAASARQEPSRDFQASENNRNMILDIPPSSQASNMSTPKIKTAVDDVASRRPIETPAAVEDIATQQACEARRSIQQELRQSNHLSCNRRTILESALSLVNKISAPSLEKGLFHENTKESEDSSHSGLEEFTLETYFMMSEGLCSNVKENPTLSL